MYVVVDAWMIGKGDFLLMHELESVKWRCVFRYDGRGRHISERLRRLVFFFCSLVPSSATDGCIEVTVGPGRVRRFLVVIVVVAFVWLMTPASSSLGEGGGLEVP